MDFNQIWRFGVVALRLPTDFFNWLTLHEFYLLSEQYDILAAWEDFRADKVRKALHPSQARTIARPEVIDQKVLLARLTKIFGEPDPD